MKKSTLVMILCLVLAVALGVGGTLAYLTDTDADVNVMVMGDVQIVQNEQQRIEQGNAEEGLEEFEQYKSLLPYVTIGTTTKEDVTVGDYTIKMRDNVKNYVDKIVTVTNIGNNDAFVRTIIAVPTGEIGYTPATQSDNWLHWNYVSDTDTTPNNGWYYGANDGLDLNATGNENGVPTGIEEWEGRMDQVNDVVINDVEYDLFIFTNKNVIAPGETTGPNMVGLYLDSRVDKDENGYFIRLTPDDVKYYIAIEDPSNVQILVASQAVQADGFEEAGAWYALDAAFGDISATNHPWIDGMPEVGSPDGDKNDTNNPPVFAEVTVKDSAELAKAIDDGYDVIGLSAGEFTMPKEAKGKTLTFIGAGADKTTITVVPAGQGEAGGQLDYNLDGSTVEFNDLTIKTNSKTYAGYARLSGTYNNCTIQNTYNLGVGNSEFNDCTFNITNEYLRVGGAYNAAFNNCTFNTDGRALLVFQDGTTNDQTVTVKDCTFNATAAAKTWNGIHVSAVSIDGSQGGTYVVKLEGNNVVDSDFNGLWQIKAGAENVTVNE